MAGGEGGSFIIGYVNELTWKKGDSAEAEALTGQEASVTHAIGERRVRGHFCGSDNAYVWSVFSHRC